MSITTTASLLEHTGPAMVRWFTSRPNQLPFDRADEAMDFADTIFKQQGLAAWVEFTTGPAYFPN